MSQVNQERLDRKVARRVANYVATHKNTLMYCRAMESPLLDPKASRCLYIDWLSGEIEEILKQEHAKEAVCLE